MKLTQIGCHGNVPRGIEKLISGSSSTNPENLAKLGPVDVDNIGLTGIGKNKKQQQNISEMDMCHFFFTQPNPPAYRPNPTRPIVPAKQIKKQRYLIVVWHNT